MITMLWGLVAAPLVTVSLVPWLPWCSLWVPAAVGMGLALLTATVSWRFDEEPVLAAWWWLAVVGAVLGLIDSLHHRLPFPWLAILLIGGLAVFGSHRPEALGRLLAASTLVLALGLVVQWLLPGEIGFGDTLLLTALAPFWVWHGWATVLTGLITSHVTLGVLAGLTWLAGLQGPGARVAAGPGLLLGAWIPLL